MLLPLRPNRAISFVGPLGENGIARLRPNVTIEDASADIERMIPILMSTSQDATSPGRTIANRGVSPWTLGAQIAVLQRMLMGRVLALVLVGLALGLAGAAMLARLMESLVFGVTPHDPVTYAQVSAILGLTAICAGYLPARRITRIDPTSALRAE